jgi:hypothetical protein
MAKTENTGYWECTNCRGRDVYVSEEISGAMAVTINTPGPIDPTYINPIKNKVTRCNVCSERAMWVLTPEALKAKGRRENSQMVWIGYIFSVVFAGMGFYFWLTWPYDFDLTIILIIGAMVLFSLIFFVVGYGSSQMKKIYRKQDHEK